MTLHTPYTLETTQHLPRGYAAASDHLRIELIHRLGGLYTDGDVVVAPHPDGGPCPVAELFARVAGSAPGFALHRVEDRYVNNDAVVAPAGHPAIALWRELTRLNYLRDQRALLGDGALDAASRPGHPVRASWAWSVTPARTGRVHHRLLAQLGIEPGDLQRLSPALRHGSDLSWTARPAGDPAVPFDGADPVPRLAECVTLLRRHLLDRAGDLYLTGVAHLVRGLPDPDSAWTALLLALRPLTADLRLPVTSLTDRRRNPDGSLDVVTLPPEAEALLDRDADPPQWFGSDRATGRQAWFLDERTVPVALRGAAVPGTEGTRWASRGTTAATSPAAAPS